MEKIIKKIDELAEVITAVQSKNDKLEKKYDGIYNDQIKDLSDKAVEIQKSIEVEKNEKTAQLKRIDELEKILSRGTNSSGSIKSAGDLYDDAFMRYLRKGDRIAQEIAENGIKSFIATPGVSDRELEMKTMQVGINPEGGYWVIPQRLAATVGRNFETSPMRQIANVITTTSDSVEMIIDDDESTDGGNTTELAARVQTAEPEIGLIQIYTHEKYTLHKITQKLLDDAGFNVGAWLLNKINKRLGRQQNQDYISGTGANEARGILDYVNWAAPGVYQRNALERIVSGNATALTADGLIDLQNALQEVYQVDAKFLMRRQSWGEIIKLKETGTGAYLIDPALLRNGDGRLVLLGQPVLFASDMPAIGAGSLSVSYGDFQEGYTIVDKVGVTTIRDNITDKGRVIFYVSRRTGGAVTNFESIKTQVTSV